MDRLIIKIEDNEFSIHKAEKEAEKAKNENREYVFDLLGVKDTNRKSEIIKRLSVINY